MAWPGENTVHGLYVARPNFFLERVKGVCLLQSAKIWRQTCLSAYIFAIIQIHIHVTLPYNTKPFHKNLPSENKTETVSIQLIILPQQLMYIIYRHLGAH